MDQDWTDEQQRVFGRVYRFMLKNQQWCRHPEMSEIKEEHWNTLANNAAWLAAEMLAEGEFELVDVDSGELLTTSHTAKLNA